MNKANRIILIIVLMFSASICFATNADEEERELNAAILAPIMGHFPEYSSIRKVLSNKVIEQEVLAKRQFSAYEAQRVSDKLMKNDPLLISMNKPCEAETADTSDDDEDRSYEEIVTSSILSTWHNKRLDCGEYATLVLVIFEFNQINQVVQHKPVTFKTARIIMTADKTGDHAFALIEGMSGTVFVVDPWLGKVIRLSSNFMHVIPLKYKTVDLNDIQNQEINKFFSHPYYDVIHVSDQTIWRIDNISSANIFDAVHTYNDHMKKLYKILKSNFPLWTVKYKLLFPEKCVGTLKKPPPECKTKLVMDID